MGIWDKIKDFGKGVKDKISSNIETRKATKEQEKILENEFIKNSKYVDFVVYYKNGKNKKFGGHIYVNDHKILLDSDLNKNEVDKITDNKGNEYFIEYIKPTKAQFIYKIAEGTFEEIPLIKELDEITYTNEKPKEDKPPVYNTYNITQTDNSTTYRGIKQSNINSTDSKVDKKTEVSVDVSANLKQNKGE